jgi:hypothetical protein
MTSTSQIIESTCAPGMSHYRHMTNWWVGATVGIAVAYVVTLASLWLDRPGLYMDETNFVHAAFGDEGGIGARLSSPCS